MRWILAFLFMLVLMAGGVLLYLLLGPWTGAGFTEGSRADFIAITDRLIEKKMPTKTTEDLVKLNQAWEKVEKMTGYISDKFDKKQADAFKNEFYRAEKNSEMTSHVIGDLDRHKKNAKETKNKIEEVKEEIERTQKAKKEIIEQLDEWGVRYARPRGNQRFSVFFVK